MNSLLSPELYIMLLRHVPMRILPEELVSFILTFYVQILAVHVHVFF